MTKFTLPKIKKIVAQNRSRFDVTVISAEVDGVPREFKETTFDGQPLDLYLGWTYFGVSPEEFMALCGIDSFCLTDLTDNAEIYLREFCTELDNKRIRQ